MTTLEKAYQQEVAQIESELSLEAGAGLSEQAARQALEQYGPNAIQAEKPLRLLVIALRQFSSPMVLLLGAAAGLSFYFQEWLDAAAIGMVILVNALIGFFMEWQASRSMQALKKMVAVPAKVIREGQLREIPAEQVVPGDVLFVEAGDMVLADARIFQATQLQTDESALTGESLPVAKDSSRIGQEVTLAERANMLFKGTFVVKGNARAIVTGTGMHTELGKIATLVQQAEQAATPLEKKLQAFSKKLIWITAGLVVIIFIAGLVQGSDLVQLVQTTIALAVAAIPEGLPIVSTLALAQGMLRMARQKVIVKKLAAVETLGGTNVICTDKTGTLTENKIVVNTILVPAGKAEVRYGQDGRVQQLPEAIARDPAYPLLLQCGVLCNTANLELHQEQIREVGDPLETGLLRYALAAGLDLAALRTDYPVLQEQAFTSETKIMGTLHQAGAGYRVFAKGAVEELLEKCAGVLTEGNTQVLDEDKKQEWISRAERMATAGLRVLAFAFKEEAQARDQFLDQLTFLGLLGLLDPVRQEVPQAIAECKSAGIRVIMITGDHPATARNIGEKLGLTNGADGQVLHGKDLKDYAALTQEDKQRWLSTRIFARVTPRQKLDLVTLLQENQAIVGMTGDGVNDAPALKKADIGIAMGLRGTQVAQEVADMVLKDDSFSSIVVAIRQGRIIFENIRKFVTYLLSCNISELLVVALTSLLNLPFALIPLQILFINLVTDVLPALALGLSAGNPLIMQNSPRDPKSEIIDTKRWIAIGAYAAVITVCVLGAVFFSQTVLHQQAGWHPDLRNNILFFTLIFSQLLHVFNMVSARLSFFHNEVMGNKYVWYALAVCLLVVLASHQLPVVREALGLQPTGFFHFLVCLGFSLLSLLLIQLLKRTRVIV